VYEPGNEISISLHPYNHDIKAQFLYVLQYTGHTQKNVAVLFYSPLIPHHSFVYALYKRKQTIKTILVTLKGYGGNTEKVGRYRQEEPVRSCTYLFFNVLSLSSDNMYTFNPLTARL
jgi:hypothetical protein